MLSVINVILGLVGLLCSLGIMIGFPGLIIALIVESSRKVSQGERRSFKWTKIFVFSFIGSLVLMIVVLGLWAVASFALTTL